MRRHWIVSSAARILITSIRRVSAPEAQSFGFKGIMRRIFSTDDLEPRHRYDSWHEVACKYVIPHDSVPDHPEAFTASLDAATLGELSLVSFDAGSMTCRHEKHHLDDMADELILVRQTRGRMVIEQGKRAVSLDPGEMTLVEPRLAYQARLAPGTSLLVTKFSRRNMIERVGRIDQFVARKLSTNFGQTGLLSDFLGVLPAHTEALGATAAQVSNQLLDLLAAGLWQLRGDEIPRVASSRALLRMQLRAAIERSVSPHPPHVPCIPKSAGIGVRRANAILSADGTSIA